MSYIAVKPLEQLDYLASSYVKLRMIGTSFLQFANLCITVRTAFSYSQTGKFEHRNVTDWKSARASTVYDNTAVQQ